MDKYELVGIINPFHIIPDFVFPVFRRQNCYYFQNGDEKTAKISRFSEVGKSNEKKIIFLSDIKNNLAQQRIIDITSVPIFAFQASTNFVFVGTYDEMRLYLKKYVTSDISLEAEIKDFLCSPRK